MRLRFLQDINAFSILEAILHKIDKDQHSWKRPESLTLGKHQHF